MRPEPAKHTEKFPVTNPMARLLVNLLARFQLVFPRELPRFLSVTARDAVCHRSAPPHRCCPALYAVYTLILWGYFYE